MPLVFDPALPPPHLRNFLADLGPKAQGLDLGIDPRDEMLAFLAVANQGDLDRALFAYFRSGASIADTLEQLLRFHFGADPTRLGAVLDFASGYGRVTRFLTRAIPPANLWVADIYAEGVRFQEQRFGVHGLVSTVRPEDFRCERRFDAILVTSLFTHLPEETFRGWLRTLLGLLNPGGLLLFTAHAPELLPAGTAIPESGILFAELSESDSLAKSDYGSSWVTEEFVRGAVSAAGAPQATVHRLSRGLCNFQDLFLVAPQGGPDLAHLSFQSEPELFLERAVLPAPGRIELSGWATARFGAVRSIALHLDRELLASAPVEHEREDVAAFLGDERYRHCGWQIEAALPRGASLSSAILRLSLLDGRGNSNVLWSSSIEGALLTSTRHDVETLSIELDRRLATWDLERRATAGQIEALEGRIRAMEASRFWKMRNVWFQFKQRVGLMQTDS